VRYALDWITRALRSAGSNAYDISTSECPASGTLVEAIDVDSDGNGIIDGIRLKADIRGANATDPPDGKLGGDAGACNQEGEDVQITYNSGARTIRFQDMNTDASASDMTEPVIEGMEFVFYDSSHTMLCSDPCTNPASLNEDLVAFVKVRVTGQSQAYNAILGDPTTTTLESEVRIRTR